MGPQRVFGMIQLFSVSFTKWAHDDYPNCLGDVRLKLSRGLHVKNNVEYRGGII